VTDSLIRQNLLCGSGQTDGSIRLRHAEIGGSCSVGQTKFAREFPAVVILEGVQADTLVLPPASHVGAIQIIDTRCHTLSTTTPVYRHSITTRRFDFDEWPEGQDYLSAWQNAKMTRDWRGSELVYRQAVRLAESGDAGRARKLLRAQRFRNRWIVRATTFRAGLATLVGWVVALIASLVLSSSNWFVAAPAGLGLAVILALLGVLALGRQQDRRAIRSLAEPRNMPVVVPEPARPTVRAVPAGEPDRDSWDVVVAEARTDGRAAARAEVRAVLREEVAAAVKVALSGPELVDFTGFLRVQAAARVDDDGAVVADRGSSVELELSLTPDPAARDTVRQGAGDGVLAVEPVHLDGGRRAGSARFDLVLDSETLSVIPRRATLTVRTDGDDPARLPVTVTAPERPGSHEVWVQLYQSGQLVQARAVPVRLADDPTDGPAVR
jgi:hypothetical protein